MGVGLIFKIAAVGILVTILRTCLSDQSCRTDPCADMDPAIYL